MSEMKREQRSCSTMIAMGTNVKDGSIIFGKNSDRPLNEAQPLIYYPAVDYEENSFVECSFIRIPQVKHTNACIGSRPYVFFGFEHGVNEHGLMIGNEQVSGKEIPERRWGLIGMDILRLALERTSTAQEAVELMGNLLETYGTGGDPSVRISSFNANYIVADPSEAYIFESHQRSWVAKKISNVGYISNCYSIQEEYTFIGKNVIEEAVLKGWVHEDQKFNPAKAFTVDDCLYGEAEGFLRYNRLGKIMTKSELFTPKMMMSNLKDHYDGETYGKLLYSPVAAKIPCICCHPGGLRGCATAASVVTVLRKDVPNELKFTYWGSMAPPCCSIFRPFYNVGEIPKGLSDAHSLYSEEQQWWIFIELERYIALNYEKFAPKVRAGFDQLENEFLEEALHVESRFNGDATVLKDFSNRAYLQSLDLAKTYIKDIKTKIKTVDIDRMLLNYFIEASLGCGMPYDQNIIK